MNKCKKREDNIVMLLNKNLTRMLSQQKCNMQAMKAKWGWNPSVVMFPLVSLKLVCINYLA